MKNYVFIYYNSAPTGDMPMEEVRGAWMAWFTELGDKVVDAGNPFGDGAKVVMADGVVPVSDRPATGYSIVKADSLDAAVALAQTCPLVEHVKDAGVAVYETMPM